MADNKAKPTKLSVAALIEALKDETRRAGTKALVKPMQQAPEKKSRSPDSWRRSAAVEA